MAKTASTSKLKTWVLLWLKRIVFFVLLIFVAFQLWCFAHIVYWKYQPVGESAFMAQQREALQTKADSAKYNPTQLKPAQLKPVLLKHKWVAYDNISDNLKRAVIASEDANFGEHEGVDWAAINRAREKNKKKGKVIAGGSTITMQLAKNLFLSGERSYVRKGQELIITYMLEAVLDKERILEIYLNVAEWGVGVFGAQAAAQHHFGISAAQLSATQAARLAAMLPRPRFYDANRNSPYLQTRTDWVLYWLPQIELP